MVPDFKDIQANRPSVEITSDQIAALQEQFKKAGSAEDRHQCIMQWDARREERAAILVEVVTTTLGLLRINNIRKAEGSHLKEPVAFFE